MPLRDALSAERDRAKAGREALIAEAVALAARATERDSLNQVKAIQARWQVEAKARRSRIATSASLWEAFRAACDAVFNARHAKRKEEDERKHGNRRALEEICAQLEALAHATDKDDAEVRRALREAQDQWRQHAGRPDPSTSGVEARFRNAKSAVETMLSARARSRESAVWQTLAAKERLCEDLDRAVAGGRRRAMRRTGGAGRGRHRGRLVGLACAAGRVRSEDGRAPRCGVARALGRWRRGRLRGADRKGPRHRATNGCSSSRWR